MILRTNRFRGNRMQNQLQCWYQRSSKWRQSGVRGGVAVVKVENGNTTDEDQDQSDNAMK
jgi:hypothetical protein